jgi:hypothetical protein
MAERVPGSPGNRPGSVEGEGKDAEGPRPTPLDPFPGEDREGPSHPKTYPPELGTDAIAILEGRTFMFSDAKGDVPPDSIGGLLHDDTRYLGTWMLILEGEPLSLLKSGVVDYYSAAFFLTNPELPDLRANTLSVRRLRFVGGGLASRSSWPAPPHGRSGSSCDSPRVPISPTCSK